MTRPLSRHCHPEPGVPACFLDHCGFPVIYFISNIFFPAAAKLRPARRVDNAGLTGAVNS
jgi:hypothetical protein